MYKLTPREKALLTFAIGLALFASILLFGINPAIESYLSKQNELDTVQQNYDQFNQGIKLLDNQQKILNKNNDYLNSLESELLVNYRKDHMDEVVTRLFEEKGLRPYSLQFIDKEEVVEPPTDNNVVDDYLNGTTNEDQAGQTQTSTSTAKNGMKLVSINLQAYSDSLEEILSVIDYINLNSNLNLTSYEIVPQREKTRGAYLFDAYIDVATLIK